MYNYNPKCETIVFFDHNNDEMIIKEKVKFITSFEAQLQANIMNKKTKTSYIFDVYFCDTCSHYHIGKSNRKKEKKKIIPKTKDDIISEVYIKHLNADKIEKRFKSRMKKFNKSYNFKYRNKF